MIRSGTVLSLVLLFTAAPSFAQTPTIPPMSPYENHGIFSINLQNLSIVFNVPIRNKSGTIPLNSSIFGVTNLLSPGTGTRTTISVSGLSTSGILSTNGMGTGAVIASASNTGFGNVHCPDGTPTIEYFDWSFATSDGNVHRLPTTDIVDLAGCIYPGFTDTAIDGSGYTVTLSASGRVLSATVHGAGGSQFTGASSAPDKPLTTITDTNGNTISQSSTAVTDSLGQTALTIGNGGVYSWTDVNSGMQQTSLSTTSYIQKTAFGCASPSLDIINTTASSFVTGVNFADGTTLGISYETTPGDSSKRTGRIAALTLQTGGSITFGYSGFQCTYMEPQSMTMTTTDGTWTYTWSPLIDSRGAYGNTTTVVDPVGNTTVYSFAGNVSTLYQGWNDAVVMTQKVVNQGASTPLSTVLTCYNGNLTNCTTTITTYPITQIDTFTTLAGMSTSNHQRQTFDAYGNVLSSSAYDFGASSPTVITTTQYGSWNGSSCQAIATYINNKPCKVLTTDGTNNLSESRFSYDSHGNSLTTYEWTGSSWLSNATPNVYNSNGTIATSYDLANNTTSYAYNGTGGCNNAFPTSVTSGGLTTYKTWNCDGGVLLTTSLPNESTVVATNGYANASGTADSFWRKSSGTDTLGNKAYAAYAANTLETTFNFESSVIDPIVTVDGLGRATLSQVRQGPSSSSYDTVSTSYGWNGLNRTKSTTVPCTQPLGTGCSTGLTTAQFDALGRAVSTVDGGNGTVLKSYPQNDLLTKLEPAPSGENIKSVQRETDGLGRVKSVCAILSSGGSSCGQNTSASGVLTSYAYSTFTGGSQVTVTRGLQTRTTVLDALGRVTSSTTPEAGTMHSYYDVQTACPGSSNGHLTRTVDPNGNSICYTYDSLNRVTVVNSNGTACRQFYYDNSNGFTGTKPAGVTITHPYGHMVEAATTNCGSTLITDEWFSYDARGQVTDMWEMTPHSGQYYHSTAAFHANGQVKTLQLASPSLYTMTYGLDGEGRWNTLTDTTTSTSLVAGATYFPAANPAVVSLTGSTPDNDSYTYDTNTGRMTKFVFTVGNTPKNMTGNLTWNTNGTLKQLAITDGFNSGGTQTCNFNPTAAAGTGYDDLGRLVGVDCGSGQWGQTYSYDIYNNLTKSAISGRTGTTWNPGYSASNNHCVGCTYDANGDVMGDGNNVYGWNEFSKLKWTAMSGTPTCGISGSCLVYDAFGRIVEQSNGSTWIERWITQLGETAYMSGASPQYAYWPAPGGQGKVLILGNSSNYDYLHYDWLGNARITSGITNHAVGTDQAYSPFGELYDIFGSGAAEFETFGTLTGDFDPAATTPVMWDTPNRELSMVGRWLSPDPAGAGWNLYAYSANPLSSVDPSGLMNVSAEGFAGWYVQMRAGLALQWGGNWNEWDVAFGTVPADQHPWDNPSSGDPILQLMGNFNRVIAGVFRPELAMLNWGLLNWNLFEPFTASGMADTTVTVGWFHNTFANPYGHIAMGVGSSPLVGQNPASDAQFVGDLVLYEDACLGGLACDPLTLFKVPGAILPEDPAQVPIWSETVDITAGEGIAIQTAIGLSKDNPPPYSLGAPLPACDCGSWAQQMLKFGGIDLGPPTWKPEEVMNQLYDWILGPL